MNEPARGYSRPPFEKDNRVAAKSGAWSPRILAERADALRPTLAAPLESCEWIQDTDTAEVAAWLRAEALVRALHDTLARRMTEHDGEIEDADKWLLERIRAAENAAQACRDRLLLNPLNRYRAGRDAAAARVDLIAIRSRGAQAWVERDAKDAARASLTPAAHSHDADDSASRENET